MNERKKKNEATTTEFVIRSTQVDDIGTPKLVKHLTV